MFGRPLQLANEDNNLPSLEERGIEQEIDDEVRNWHGNNINKIVIKFMVIKGDFITIDGSDAIYDVNDRYVALEDEENEENDENLGISILTNRDEQIIAHRSGSKKFQSIQAEKMKEASRKRFICVLLCFMFQIFYFEICSSRCWYKRQIACRRRRSLKN